MFLVFENNSLRIQSLIIPWICLVPTIVYQNTIYNTKQAEPFHFHEQFIDKPLYIRKSCPSHLANVFGSLFPYILPMMTPGSIQSSHPLDRLQIQEGRDTSAFRRILLSHIVVLPCMPHSKQRGTTTDFAVTRRLSGLSMQQISDDRINGLKNLGTCHIDETPFIIQLYPTTDRECCSFVPCNA